MNEKVVFHLENAAYFTRAPDREVASDKKVGEHPPSCTTAFRQAASMLDPSSGVNTGLVKRHQSWIRHDAGSKKGGETRPVVVVMV